MNILTPNDAIKKTWRKIPGNIKVGFFSAFAIGLLTHMFMLTNSLPNEDELISVVGNLEWATNVNGRWFLSSVAAFSSIFSMPWVNGMLSILYLSVSVCLIIETTQVKRYLNCILIAGILVTFPVVAGLFTFMQHSDPYSFSILLSCLAVFLANRYKFGYLFAIIPLVLSLAIYQTFFAVAAALFIMILILEILKNQESLQKTITKAIRFFVTLGAGMVIYLLSIRVLYPDGLTPYQNIDQMGQISISELPSSVLRAYWEIMRFFLRDSRGFHCSFMVYIFILSFIACGVLIILLCYKKQILKEPVKMLLLSALLLLFPLGCNIVYVMGAVWVHEIMIFGTVFIPVFLIIITDLYFSDTQTETSSNTSCDTVKKKFTKSAVVSSWVITISAMVLIFNYWIFTNQVYFKLNIAYETTYAQSILLVSHIQRLDGYTYDKDIILVGHPQIPQGIPELSQIAMFGAPGPDLFGSWAYPHFLRNYLNFTQNVILILPAQLDNKVYINESAIPIRDIVTGMPAYPDPGSAVIIGDKIFVRFAYIDACCGEFWPDQRPTCCTG